MIRICNNYVVQDLTRLVRIILARIAYFLQDGFYWKVTRDGSILPILHADYENLSK